MYDTCAAGSAANPNHLVHEYADYACDLLLRQDTVQRYWRATQTRVSQREGFVQQKREHSIECSLLQSNGGMDGDRTRDLRRDRPAL